MSKVQVEGEELDISTRLPMMESNIGRFANMNGVIDALQGRCTPERCAVEYRIFGQNNARFQVSGNELELARYEGIPQELQPD